MNCTHCLLKAPISCGLPHAAKAVRSAFARTWRSAVESLAQLG